MEVDKEIIIEFNKMLLDHSDTLLKVAGGLAVVDLLLIAHMRHAHQQHERVANASLLVFGSAVSRTFIYLAIWQTTQLLLPCRTTQRQVNGRRTRQPRRLFCYKS